MNKKMLLLHYRKRKAYKTLPPQFFDKLPSAVYEEAKCGFVLSTGRCGTGLLTRILEKCRNVDVYHTPIPELKIASKNAYEQKEEDNNTHLAVVAAARYELILESYICNRNFVETNNRITFFAPQLAELFKNAVFLHVVRHPADFVKSAVRREYYQNPKIAPGLIHPLTEDLTTRWENMTFIERSAWLWNETNRFIEDFAKTIPSSRFLRVKAENIFTDYRYTSRILEFLRAEKIPDRTLKRIIQHPINSQKTGFYPNYANCTAELKCMLSENAPLTAFYGYEI
jgi:hypothetical protein